VKNIYCSVFGHQYVITKKITLHVNEYKCKHCSVQMTTNSKGELTPLTPKYKEINLVLRHIHNKKMAKQENLLVFKH